MTLTVNGLVRWGGISLCLHAACGAAASAAPTPEFAVRRVGPMGPNYTSLVSLMVNASGTVGGKTQNGQGFEAWQDQAGLVRVVNPIGPTWQSAGGTSVALLGHALLTDDGVMAGHALHPSAGGDSGWEAWYHDGSSTLLIGLREGVYAQPTSTGFDRYVQTLQLSEEGLAAGTSRRLGALGVDAWAFDGMTTRLIGLQGGEYEVVRGGLIYREGSVVGGRGFGRMVAGHADRPGASVGSSLGKDTWIDDGASSVRTNPFGGVYQWTDGAGRVRRDSTTLPALATGVVGGTAKRFDASGASLGSDAWVYAGGTTHVVEVVGSPYEQVVAGGIRRTSTIVEVRADGASVGHATRHGVGSVAGNADVWFARFDAAPTIINPTGGLYEGGGTRSSSVQFAGDGAPVGRASHIGADGSARGGDVWRYDQGVTSIISLSGSGYEYSTASGLVRTSNFTASNLLGQVIGSTARYGSDGSPLGAAGWFFDPLSGSTSPLEFSIGPGGVSTTSAQLLTESGLVLGTYQRFDGAGSTRSIFMWSASGGFADILDLIPGGLAGTGLLSDHISLVGYGGESPSGIPRFILAKTRAIGQTNADAPFLISLVPSPAGTAAMLSASGLVAMRRRRTFIVD